MYLRWWPRDPQSQVWPLVSVVNADDPLGSGGHSDVDSSIAGLYPQAWGGLQADSTWFSNCLLA